MCKRVEKGATHCTGYSQLCLVSGLKLDTADSKLLENNSQILFRLCAAWRTGSSVANDLNDLD